MTTPNGKAFGATGTSPGRQDASLIERDTTQYSPFNPPLPQTAGERRRWSYLYGSTKALVIAQAACRHRGPVLVITPDPLAAERLEDELRFYSGESRPYPLLSFPDWETLPYDRFSPYQDIVSERLATLARLPSLKQGILIAPVATLMHRLAPPEYIQANTLVLKVGEQLDRERLRERLQAGGYRCVSQVMEHGDFAVRGSLIDVFPMGSLQPYRIDWFDEDIDSIRLFDPETQRSIESVEAIEVLPAREFALTGQAIQRFRSNWRLNFPGNPLHCPIYKEVSQGLAPAGIEYYLPLFFERTATLFDYLPAMSLVVMDEGVEYAAEAFCNEVYVRYEQHCHDVERPLLEPTKMFLQLEELLRYLETYAVVSILDPTAAAEGILPGRASLLKDGSSPLSSPPAPLLSPSSPSPLQGQRKGGSGPSPHADSCAVEAEGADRFATSIPVRLPIDARAPDPLGIVKHFIKSFQGRVLFVAESKGRRETLLELFHQHGLALTPCADWETFLQGPIPIGLCIASIHQGAQIDEPPLAIISESQLFGERARQRRPRYRGSHDVENLVRNLTELNPGAPVVHEQHGVGRYLGLFTMEVGGVEGEFIGIEYADQDRLYVPVSSLHLISRYSGVDPEHAPLHKLGSYQWHRARAKAARRIHDVAAELLEIYARRAARIGHAFVIDHEAYQAFVQGFPFEETPDQETTIAAVLSDMQSPQPMDRLVCGDVGFGKTEVAMRAAFIAAMAGKQVAILVPTTLLAQQHYQNFKDRFADWPIRIEQLSRFLAKRAQDSIIAGLEDGSVDIVIGTHKLLEDSIKFKRLGLVIIDEEHRFGVRQKERLKSLRSEIDILTLTATPIPRTLNLALCGARDLSIIATPPARRLAVKTFISEWNDALLREALLREVSRGGQVYFLHNEVETIDRTAQKVQALVPETQVRIAHGQMRERELERVMLDFYHRRFNVLVCTTIIESGIDVPSANTIVINRADKFGLAQLYQLRGRVGRSHHRAYAYLLIPPRKAMTVEAVRRLEAIASLEELGLGFTLATHDLEIRGAGEILGEEQSGHIQEIGFGLYLELLERAIAALKAGRQPVLDRPLDHGVEIDLHAPVLLPQDYLPDVHTRLIMYKRIASARDIAELNELREEMVDRFGPLPQPAKDLFRVTALKLKATLLGIRKIDLGSRGGYVHFHPQPNIDPTAIVRLVQSDPQTYRFEQTDRLRILQEMSDCDAKIHTLDTLFDYLGAARDAA